MQDKPTGTKQKLQKMNKNKHNLHPRKELAVQEFKYRPRGDVPTLAEVCDVELFSPHSNLCTEQNVVIVKLMR